MRMTANVALALYLLTLPFLMCFLPDYEMVAGSVFLLTGCVCALATGWGVRPMAVTLTDVLVFLLCLWACASVVFVRHGMVDTLHVYGWVAMLLLYVVCSRMERTEVFGLYAVWALSGTVQAVWALLQANGFCADATADFAVTGGFSNPGPLGGYLAVSLAAALGCMREVKVRAGKALVLMMLLLIGVALVVTDSRAAWLSALSAFAFWGWDLLPDKMRCWGKRWYVLLAASAVVAGMLFGLYQYKKTSADVRLLIWRAGAEMFADAPLCGHGVASFPMKYMDYQGDWLERHPDSRFHALADNNVQAFCEPLALACEQGIVGCVLVAALVWMALSGSRCRHYRPALLAIGVFSCFSYPADVLALKMLFPMLMGTLACRRVLFTWVPDRKTVGAVCCVALLLSGGVGMAVVHRYRDAFRHLTDETADSEACELPYHQRYMARYAMLLLERGEDEAFCRTVGSGSFPFVTSVLCCDLGTAYRSCGRMSQAEETMVRAYKMVPPKILPRFCLLRLYRELGRNEDAKRMAEEILSLEVKQKGTVYLEARTEASLFLKEMSECFPQGQ